MEVSIGSIVKFENGYFRVSANQGKGDKRWVNLTSIFGTKVHHKRVPYSQITEAQEEWYNRWSQSQSYMEM
jgi:hypothetical protein